MLSNDVGVVLILGLAAPFCVSICTFALEKQVKYRARRELRGCFAIRSSFGAERFPHPIQRHIFRLQYFVRLHWSVFVRLH
jgi:hypothetical protein